MYEVVIGRNESDRVDKRLRERRDAEKSGGERSGGESGGGDGDIPGIIGAM